jgi:hypothetical protein
MSDSTERISEEIQKLSTLFQERGYQSMVGVYNDGEFEMGHLKEALTNVLGKIKSPGTADFSISFRSGDNFHLYEKGGETENPSAYALECYIKAKLTEDARIQLISARGHQENVFGVKKDLDFTYTLSSNDQLMHCDAFNKAILGATQQSKAKVENDTDEKLIALGKLKGEIEGEFVAYYIAADKDGVLYRNYDPSFENGWNKKKGWEEVAVDLVKADEKDLKFLPTISKESKPILKKLFPKALKQLKVRM